MVLWILCGIVVAIVVLWDREPLSPIWLKAPRWHSLGWGLLLALVLVAIVGR